MVTDIDGIGVFGDYLLLVDCFSKPYSDLYHIGDHRSIRNAAEDVEEKARQWQKRQRVLESEPKGANYDFSAYNTIIAVVCTPSVIYVEPGIMGKFSNCVLEELQSLQQAAPGLRAVASLAELEAWLHNMP